MQNQPYLQALAVASPDPQTDRLSPLRKSSSASNKSKSSRKTRNSPNIFKQNAKSKKKQPEEISQDAADDSVRFSIEARRDTRDFTLGGQSASKSVLENNKGSIQPSQFQIFKPLQDALDDEPAPYLDIVARESQPSDQLQKDPKHQRTVTQVDPQRNFELKLEEYYAEEYLSNSISNIESKSAEDMKKTESQYYSRHTKNSNDSNEAQISTPLIFRKNKDIRVSNYKETPIGGLMLSGQAPQNSLPTVQTTKQDQLYQGQVAHSQIAQRRSIMQDSLGSDSSLKAKVNQSEYQIPSPSASSPVLSMHSVSTQTSISSVKPKSLEIEQIFFNIDFETQTSDIVKERRPLRAMKIPETSWVDGPIRPISLGKIPQLSHKSSFDQQDASAQQSRSFFQTSQEQDKKQRQKSRDQALIPPFQPSIDRSETTAPNSNSKKDNEDLSAQTLNARTQESSLSKHPPASSTQANRDASAINKKLFHGLADLTEKDDGPVQVNVNFKQSQSNFQVFEGLKATDGEPEGERAARSTMPAPKGGLPFVFSALAADQDSDEISPGRKIRTYTFDTQTVLTTKKAESQEAPTPTLTLAGSRSNQLSKQVASPGPPSPLAANSLKVSESSKAVSDQAQIPSARIRLTNYVSMNDIASCECADKEVDDHECGQNSQGKDSGADDLEDDGEFVMNTLEYDETALNKQESFFSDRYDDQQVEDRKSEKAKPAQLQTQMTRVKANQIAQNFAKEFEKVPIVTKPSASPNVPLIQRSLPTDSRYKNRNILPAAKAQFVTLTGKNEVPNEGNAFLLADIGQQKHGQAFHSASKQTNGLNQYSGAESSSSSGGYIITPKQATGFELNRVQSEKNDQLFSSSKPMNEFTGSKTASNNFMFQPPQLHTMQSMNNNGIKNQNSFESTLKGKNQELQKAMTTLQDSVRDEEVSLKFHREILDETHEADTIVHCPCCPIGQLKDPTRKQTETGESLINSKHAVVVVEFDPKIQPPRPNQFIPDKYRNVKQYQQTQRPTYQIVPKAQDAWQFVETGRMQNTFDTEELLGEGGFGQVFKVKHKLDGQIYALKKIQIFMEFNPEQDKKDRWKTLLANPAMKEIEAISKLSHKNIVGYKGCWVEGGEPNMDTLDRIQAKQYKRRIGAQVANFPLSINDEISEDSDDDSERAKERQLQDELHNERRNQIYSDDSGSDQLGSQAYSGSSIDLSHSGKNRQTSSEESESDYYDGDSESSYRSECQSDTTLYGILEQQQPFACLNIMIQMEFAEGKTLTEVMNEAENGLDRKTIYEYFIQIMQGLKYIHNQGLIHRDIKPDNIFVNPKTGRLKIGDFGLAKKFQTQEQKLMSNVNLHDQPNNTSRRKAGIFGVKAEHSSKPNHDEPSLENLDSNGSNSQNGKEREEGQGSPKDVSMRGLGGTAMYLSPEIKAIQREVGDLKDKSPLMKAKRSEMMRKVPLDRVDIYAAGLVLYQMCGNFRTAHETCNSLHNLSNSRTFPKGFTDKFYQESKIIALMTDPVPEKRPTATHFLNKSPEFQCYSFDLKVGSLL